MTILPASPWQPGLSRAVHLKRGEVYERRLRRRAEAILGQPAGRIGWGGRVDLRAPSLDGEGEELPGQLGDPGASREDQRLRAWSILRGAQRLGLLPEGSGTARCACEAIPREGELPAGLYAARGAERRGEADDALHLRINGLKLCESLNLCPVCAQVRGLQWAERIARWAGLALGDGRGLYLVTLTLRHHAGRRLQELVDHLTDAWARWRSPDGGGVWDPASGLPRPLWYVRGQEETHGRHGWHPHLHVLIALPEWIDGTQREGYEDGDPLLRRYERGDRDPAAAWAGELARRWVEAVEATGGGAGGGALVAAQDVRAVPTLEGVERYLVKLGLELSGAHAKEARGRDGHTPFALLADAVTTGSPRSPLWAEYCEVMARARRISTSIGRSHPDQIYADREWTPPPQLAAPPPLQWRQILALPGEALAGLVAARADVVIREWGRQDGLALHRLEVVTRWHCELLGPAHRARGWIGVWRDVVADLLDGRLPPARYLHAILPSDQPDQLGELAELWARQGEAVLFEVEEGM